MSSVFSNHPHDIALVYYLKKEEEELTVIDHLTYYLKKNPVLLLFPFTWILCVCVFSIVVRRKLAERF